MKTIMIICLMVFLTSSVLVAQDRQQDRTQQQDQDRLHQMDYLMLQDGQMLHVQDQERSQLREQLRLSNGIVVNPDGTYQLRNGKQKQLRDGQCLAMDGQKYRSQEKIRRTLENRAQRELRRQDRNRDTSAQHGRQQSGNRARSGRKN
ncbi:DUF6799 domain-containing protein [Catalinimonas sp. 4WD22]|uniref:DUF6799 domain-containing protein n=1 Tax=Catalinimonas locisalis TaxID=3133978 RepID=UPI003100DCC0